MTELGFLGAGPLASLTTRGTVAFPAAVAGRLAGLDWWVGAEDRWHFASDEVAVRQGLGDDGASVATRMKVPGGDIVQHAFVVPLDGDGALVLEFSNETPVPVVLALELQAADAAAIDVAGEVLEVGGASVLRAQKAVAASAAGTDPAHVRAVVVAGDATPSADRTTRGDAASCVALLWPLPHTATLRVVLPFGSPQPIPQLDYVPDAAAVGRGWESHLNAAMRFSVPDDRLAGGVAMARRHVLGSADLGDPVPPTESWERSLFAAALDAWGHHQVALDMLLNITSSSTAAAERRADHLGSAVWALANHVGRTGDTALVDASKSWLTDAVAVLARLATARKPGKLLKTLGDPPAWLPADSYLEWSNEWAKLGLQAASPLLQMLGEVTTANDIRAAVGAEPTLAPIERIWAWLAPVSPPGRPRLADVVQLTAGLDDTFAISSPRSDHDAVASAMLLLVLRDALAQDSVGHDGQSEARRIDLLVGYPDAWTGAGVEVHDAPTIAGPLSYGIRWHGPRPALLWQRADDHQLSLEAAMLTVSGLDQTWSSSDVRGETLLTGNEVALGDSPITPFLERGESIDPPEPGESFS